MNTPTDYKAISKEVEEAKKREILKLAFIKITDVVDWEEAQLVYTEYTSKLDDFLGRINFQLNLNLE